MPEMDGIEVLSEMNRLHYTDDIPVIMISADGSDTNIRRAFDMGVTDYISRPYDSKVVMRQDKQYNKALFKAAPACRAD